MNAPRTIRDGVADPAMLTRPNMTSDEIARSLIAHANHMADGSNLGDLLRQAARAIESERLSGYRGADAD